MTATKTRTLGGNDLREMFTGAATWFERHVEAVNAINVFPVPDGDTGTNMHLTLRAALEEARICPADHASEMARALAKGALMGARGNSGVIFSQILRGLANSLREKERFDGASLAGALNEAADTAYASVSKPVEGTILTVARESARAATEAAARDGDDVVAVLAATVDAAKTAVANTPKLLPVLAEAGVVDAGGEGLRVVLEGALRHLRGEDVATAALPAFDTGAIRAGWAPALDAAHGAGATFGYCTEFVLTGVTAGSERLREQLAAMGDSVIVVHDGDVIRAHVHTGDPGAALSLGATMGRLRNVKIDDMQAQHVATLRPQASTTAQAPPVGIVAVAAGDGLAEVLRGVGATAIVAGGQTMNPSARELLDGVRACGSPQVIILPNNKNIVMAARQAIELINTPVRVVPTKSVPQGIAALLAFDAERTIDENAEAMTRAAQSVRTVEITRAVRDAAFKRVPVRAGQAIAIVDGELSAASDSCEDAALEALRIAAAEDAALVTLYFGADTSEDEARTLAERIGAAFPNLEVEVLRGGQPHYAYTISIE